MFMFRLNIDQVYKCLQKILFDCFSVYSVSRSQVGPEHLGVGTDWRQSGEFRHIFKE